MARLTKEAQETLDGAISKYKDFIIEHSTVYANQEDSIDITPKHVTMASNDYQNAFFYERKIMNRQKHLRMYAYMMMIMAITMLILFMFLSYKSVEDNYELVVLLSSVLGIVAVTISIVTMMLTFKRTHPQQGDDSKRQMIVDYLNKWSETESLLKNLYKKKNHKNAENIKELLVFYEELPTIIEKEKQEVIYTLLQARNNLIHRGSKDVNTKIISSLNEELDEIIELLRNTN
jgi:hypothetical protein